MQSLSNKKLAITKAVLAEIPEHLSVEYKMMTIDRLVFYWWKTGRASEALRLTHYGKLAFEKANIAHYGFDINPSKISNIDTFLVEIGKKIKCPFFISDKQIEVYDDEIALMIKLYGTLHDYLDAQKEMYNDNKKQ